MHGECLPAVEIARRAKLRSIWLARRVPLIRIDKETFLDLWDRVKASGAGEPGFYFTNDKDYGCNPCCEIS